MKYFISLNEEHLGELNRAVQQAIHAKTEEFEREKMQLAKSALAENAKAREDAAHQIEVAMAGAKVSRTNIT